FVISGFVIFMTLERTPDIWAFLKARSWRLFPTYWVAMTFTFVVTTFGSVEALQVSPTAFVANWTMVPQLLGQPPVDGAYWSLAAEWGFYATVCVLYFAGALRRPLGALAVWLGVVFAVQVA